MILCASPSHHGQGSPRDPCGLTYQQLGNLSDEQVMAHLGAGHGDAVARVSGSTMGQTERAEGYVNQGWEKTLLARRSSTDQGSS